MQCRTPSLHSAADLRRGIALPPVREAALAADFGDGGIAASSIGLSRPTQGDPSSAVIQSLPGRSRCVDDCPIGGADVIFLLQRDDLGRRVRGIALTALDAAGSGRKIGYEKEADKPDMQPARGIMHCGSFLFPGKYCVHHGGMPLGKDPHRALHQDFVNLFGNFRPVSTLGQSIRSLTLNSCLRNTSLRSTTAPGNGAMSGASARARTDFPVPDKPPTAQVSAPAGGSTGEPARNRPSPTE